MIHNKYESQPPSGLHLKGKSLRHVWEKLQIASDMIGQRGHVITAQTFFTPASFPSLPLPEIGFDFKCCISPYKPCACELLVSTAEDSTEILASIYSG